MHNNNNSSIFKVKRPLLLSTQAKVPCSPFPSAVLQHLNALKTRLNYASFKLEHGWQDRALTDLELSWKSHDKDFDPIPVPATNSRKKVLDNYRRPPTAVPKRRNSHKRGLTQADIIDRRTFVAVAQNRPKLKRWHSLNGIPEPKQKPRPKGRPRKDEEAMKRQPVDEREETGNKRTRMGGDSTATANISSSQVMDEIPNAVPTNSLDFLSFAIAMSEKKRDAAERLTQSQPLPSVASQYSDEDMEDVQPTSYHRIVAGSNSQHYNDDRSKTSATSDDYDDDEEDDEDDLPSSPRAEAAKAIMMFVRGGPHR
jgi:hypothetical protein